MDLAFFKTAVLEGIFIKDLQADTLLYAEKLKADIGLFSLFDHEIFLNKIQLEGAVSKLKKNQNDSLFNFQFVIDAFSNQDAVPKEKKNASPGWVFGIDKVQIRNTRFNLKDENTGGFELKTKVGNFEIDANKLDFENNKIALSELDLEQASVSFTILKNDLELPTDTSKLVFPGFGWEITADDLQIQEVKVQFANLNYERQADIVDYNHLGFDNIHLKISDLNINNENISANIQNASLLDHSGFLLKRLSSKIELNNEKIAANKLEIKTLQTSLNGDLQLTYNDFFDLTDFMNQVKLEAAFEPSKIAYEDLTRLVSSLREIPAIETGLDEKISLDGRIILEKNEIQFEEFDAEIGKLFSLQATGSIAQLTSDPLFNLKVKKLKTDYHTFTRLTKDIKLPVGFAQLGEFSLSGKLSGTVDKLKGKNLYLDTGSGTQFRGDLSISGLPDVENTIFKAEVDQLKTHKKDIEAISGTSFPGKLDSLGMIDFKGHYEGTMYDFVVKGNFKTDAGEIKTDLHMDFEKDYQNAGYSGNFEIIDFDLSKILEPSFGLSSLKIETKGNGLNFNDLNLEASGEIPKFSYKNYPYQNLSFSGDFLKKRFEGIAKAEDENLNFDFQGMIDMNDSLPDFQMVLNVDTVNLKTLNLMESDLAFSGELEADLKGYKLDNISGKATLQNFKIGKDSVFYSTKENISLEAFSPAINKKALHFRSEFADISIDGKFNLEEFPKSVVEFVDGFFSIEELVLADSIQQDIRQIDEQDVVFNFSFKDVVPIAKVFVPDFKEAEAAFISGKFNSSEKLLQLEGTFPRLVFGNFETDTIRIKSQGTPTDLESSIVLNQVQVGETFNFSTISTHTLFSNNELNFGINILGNGDNTDDFFQNFASAEDETKLDLKGIISIVDERYTLSLKPEFVLNDYSWKIAPENKIEYQNKQLSISDLNFLKGDQQLSINSKGPIPENDFQAIEIELSDFNLEEISNALGMKDDKIGGWINGNFILKEPKTNLHANTKIVIDSLAYNENPVGNLSVIANQSNLNPELKLEVKLEGANQMTASGKYLLQEKVFDIDFHFGRLPLFLIDPFLKGIVKESNGYLTGNMDLKGSLDQPDLNGKIKLKEFTSKAVISNTRYRFDETSIEISEKSIELGTIRLKDANDNQAVLSGNINHNYFSNIRFDLDFNTEGFQFLKTTAKENELYFGNLFLKADVDITGTPELPKLTISATTLPNTQLFVQPFTGDEIIKQEDYIIFADPEFYNEDSIFLVEQRITGNRTPFDLLLKLQVTKEATLNIIIDPITGDQLICSGDANLNLNIDPTGVLSVAGNYTIDKGSYFLNYEQLVKRNFEIEKGSSIIFSGDPMNASFDVTASYKVRASTYELLANQSVLSETEKQSSSTRIDVLVLMILKGNLNDPIITFDIRIPDTQEEGVTSALNRKLAELRTNPEELNKQAFGLLLFKSFITESGSSQTLSDAGTNMALSSVSNLLTDQLNSFAEKYVKGFDIDIGVESFTANGAQSNTMTQMQVNISKQLFSDRLTVNVGTNVNLNAENTSSIFQSNFSGIAGDFVLEYKLTESGNYNVKVFHKSDYNALEQSNIYKTGAGIIFRKSFNGKNYKD